MPRDVGGNYTLPAGNPVVPNTIIATNWANSTMQDIADALTASLSIDGSVTTAKIADDAVTRAKLNGLDANGMVAAISATEFEARTITGTANKVTVTNGDGVAGDPTLTLPDAITLVTPTVTGAATFSSDVAIKRTGGTAAGVELGNIDNQASTPFIDFHSGTDGTNDYDSRILASGGTTSDGAGTLNIIAANAQVGGSEIYRRNNILGTVGQSGGTPTGAVFQTVSNSNGIATLFADGSIIQNAVLSGAADINTAAGNVFTSTDEVWTYPVATSNTNWVTSHPASFGGTWGSALAIGASSATLQVFSASTFTGTFSLSVASMGRWF